MCESEYNQFLVIVSPTSESKVELDAVPAEAAHIVSPHVTPRNMWPRRNAEK